MIRVTIADALPSDVLEYTRTDEAALRLVRDFHGFAAEVMPARSTTWHGLGRWTTAEEREARAAWRRARRTLRARARRR